MYRIASTAIIIEDDRVLITKRTMDKKRHPGKWTVPGGNLDESDFEKEDTYDILENSLVREVKEEVGLEINNIRYLCSIGVSGGVIMSFVADYYSGDVSLQETECSEYAWVSADELKNYDLIKGIDNQIRIALERNRKPAGEFKW